jgi:hypothetical protein
MHIIGGRVTDTAGSRVKFWYSRVLVRGIIHTLAIRFGNSLSQILVAFAKLEKATIYFVMSVCPSVRLCAWNNSVPTRRIFVKFYI